MSDHETDGALGLDGLLAWSQARYVARQAAKPLAPRAARLDEAHGSILASPLLTPYDEPFADAAAFDGYGVCAGGPWTLVDLARDGVPGTPITDVDEHQSIHPFPNFHPMHRDRNIGDLASFESSRRALWPYPPGIVFL